MLAGKADNRLTAPAVAFAFPHQPFSSCVTVGWTMHWQVVVSADERFRRQTRLCLHAGHSQRSILKTLKPFRQRKLDVLTRLDNTAVANLKRQPFARLTRA